MPDFVNSFSGKKFSVYKIPRDTPENKKYAIELGTGTTWCTASRGDRNLYSRYNDQGPLYIFINKEDPADKYQIHLETENFMNKDDRPVNFNSLEYIEFYDYLINKQHEAQIVPDNIEKLLKCFEIIKKAKQYPANPDKFLIPEHVEPEDKWYLVKCETEEDVIKNFNTLNQFVCKSDESRALTVDVPGIEDLVKSKSWYVIRELNGEYTWYYVIQKDSSMTSWKMCIRSKEDFEKVEHFLKLSWRQGLRDPGLWKFSARRARKARSAYCQLCLLFSGIAPREGKGTPGRPCKDRVCCSPEQWERCCRQQV